MSSLYSGAGHGVKWHLPRPRLAHRSPRRQFRNGQRAAVLRAITAAKLYSTGAITSLAKAAQACGSNVNYVEAATVLLKAENEALLRLVLAGHEPLLESAQQAQRTADLISAYRSANYADRVAFIRTCGTDAIFDVLVEAAK